MGLPRTIVFEGILTKSESPSNLESFGKKIHQAQMARKFGLKVAKKAIKEALLWSHLGLVKYFANDPKLIVYSDFVLNFSKRVLDSLTCFSI